MTPEELGRGVPNSTPITSVMFKPCIIENLLPSDGHKSRLRGYYGKVLKRTLKQFAQPLNRTRRDARQACLPLLGQQGKDFYLLF